MAVIVGLFYLNAKRVADDKQIDLKTKRNKLVVSTPKGTISPQENFIGLLGNELFI